MRRRAFLATAAVATAVSGCLGGGGGSSDTSGAIELSDVQFDGEGPEKFVKGDVTNVTDSRLEYVEIRVSFINERDGNPDYAKQYGVDGVVGLPAGKTYDWSIEVAGGEADGDDYRLDTYVER